MTTAVTFYDVVLWLHISAVVVGFGATFAFGIYLTVAAKGDPRAIPAIIRAQCLISRSMVTIGGILILLTGIYLTADRWDFGYFFITWGILAILVLLGLVHGFFIPNDTRAREAAQRDIADAGAGEVKFGEEFNRRSAASARMGPIAGLIIVLTVYVMTAKPFL